MNLLWDKVVKTDRHVKAHNQAWVEFHALLRESAPKGFEPKDLLQAILNATEFPDPNFLELKDLELWTKRLQRWSLKGTLVQWLRQHLPQKAV